jgi:hypothetical protein
MRWYLRTPTVELELHALGGMMAPVTFRLPSGTVFKPFAISDWAAKPGSETLPPVMKFLAGDFACVPFGAPAPPASATERWKSLFRSRAEFSETHGVCANHDWSLSSQSDLEVAISIAYPEAHPIEWVRKTVTASDSACRVEVKVDVHARRADEIAFGVHPVFALARTPRQSALHVSFKDGFTFPGDYIPGVSTLAIDTSFRDLCQVPLRAGGGVDLTALPLPGRAEEVLQLCGVPGECTLVDKEVGASVTFRWDAQQLPSVVLGLANGGRQNPPFNGEWFALYVEAVASAFGIGSSIAANPDNPIRRAGYATSVSLAAGRTWSTTYSFAAHQ